MIGIADYGVGNVEAFLTTFKRLGKPCIRMQSAEHVRGATHLILPGVGAFDHAMERFDASGLREAMEHRVLREGVPLLGVCVGMQMLAEGSDEGRRAGLGWIRGRVRAFAAQPASARLPLPHMGWNDLAVRPGSRLFQDFSPAPLFYFLHSYFFDCLDAAHVAATAHYGFDFACVVSAGNVHGVQCHPEKSHRAGTALLKNFAEL